ncbi:MAG TPA: hypothetical protein VMN76_07580 [Acidobacteriota bacterium]|nr:hypothetical protein [Acidobacteriota bacterium]
MRRPVASGEPADWTGRWVGVGLGFCGILTALYWTQISSQFVYGEGHAARPIAALVLSHLLLSAALAAGWLWFRRRGMTVPLWMVLSIAVTARILLLPSNLIQENDVYRYVLDGQSILHGQNPFQYEPAAVAARGKEDFRLTLQSEEAKAVLEKIGYPSVPTVYPPVAQLSFAAGALIGGWDWRGQRIFFILVDLGLLFVLSVLLRRFGLPEGWLLVYAWNPLTLKEIANSAHFDVLVAFFLVAAVLFVAELEKGRRLLRLILAAGCLAAAVLSKLYPVLLMPLFLAHLRKQGLSWRPLLLFSATVCGLITAAFLPFAVHGFGRLTDGLTTYAAHWQMNDGLFAILDWALPWPRPAAAALVGAFALAVGLTAGSRLQDLVSRMILIVLFWLLLTPAVYPWYAIPALALSVLVPHRWVAFPVLVLSGALAIYYFSFSFEYGQMEFRWWRWAKTLEHGIILLTLAGAFLFHRTGKLSEAP